MLLFPMKKYFCFFHHVFFCLVSSTSRGCTLQKHCRDFFFFVLHVNDKTREDRNVSQYTVVGKGLLPLLLLIQFDALSFGGFFCILLGPRSFLMTKIANLPFQSHLSH